MKQIFQTHPSRLLLCLLFTLIGGGNFAWGDEVTYTFKNKSWSATSGGADANWTSGKEGAGFANNGIQVTTKASGANGTSPISFDNISKIVCTFNTNTSAGEGKIVAKIGDNTETSNAVKYTGSADGRSANFTTEFDYSAPQSGKVKLTVNTTTNSIYLVSVTITYSEEVSSAVATTTTIDASGITTTDVYAGPAAGTLTAVVKDNEDNPVAEATVTWSGDNDEVATINASTGAVTLIGAGTVTFTASYAGVDDEYKASSDTYKMTVTDSTPIPTHTVTFSVNGATTSEDFEEGAAITFPADPASIEGKVFRGWVADAIDGTTDEEPNFVTSATMGQSDVTYYAVFADVTPGTSSTVDDVLTRETTGVTGTSYSSWSNKTATSSAVYAGYSAGGNNSIQLRSKSSNSGVITTASGGILKKVTVVWESDTSDGNELQVYGNTSAYTDPTNLYNVANDGDLLGTIVCGTSTELDISGDYSYVGLRSESGALYLTSITITWSTGTPDTYSGFCTTLPADDRTAVNMTGFTATTSTLVMGVTESTATTVTNDQLGWTAAYTFTSDDTDVATVNASGVITAVGRGTANITATLNVDKEDESYKVGDVFTKSIKITVVNPSHTVAFYANGVKLSEATVQETDSIKIPEATVYEGFAFVGWAEATIDGSQAEKPELATISIMGTSDVTYYAVYAARNVSIGEITKSYGFETSESDEDWTIDGPVSSNEKKNSGSRSGKINTNHSYVTFNQKVKVKEFSFAFTRSSNNNNYNVYVETSTDNDKWDAAETYAMSTFNTDGTFITKTATFDGSAEYYVRFHCYNTTAVRYVDDVTIVYDGELVTYAPYYTTLTKSASVTSAGFATYCSNANLDFTGTGITAYYGTAVGSKLTFKPITKVPANTGVLLVCDGGKTVDVPVLSGDADDVTGNILVGVTEATTLNATDYILNVKEIDGEKKAGFFLAGTYTSLAANRAYIPASVGGSVKSFALDLEDNADGIEETLSDSLLKSENIYNLAGQRLSKMQKGINIVNGKKILK